MSDNTPKREILIADDDPVIRHLVTAMLTSAGYGVETVESGAKCIAFIEQRIAMNALPDAVLLDLQLLDMSGVEVLSKIRQLSAGSNLKVIMLSANNRDEVLALQPNASAADDFLEKPFPPARLLDTLSQHL